MKKRILLLDTGKEWGGGTNSMIELLKRIDRERFEVTALFYRNYRKGNSSDLKAVLTALGIELQLLTPFQQPRWAKLLKELVRGVLCFSPRLREQAVYAIEMRWRILPMATKIAERLRDGAYDLLYMNNQPSSNLEGYLAGEMAGCPVVQHCRIEASLMPQEVEITNRIAHRLLCVSEGVRLSLIEQGVDPLRCQTIHNAIDVHQSLPEPRVLPFRQPHEMVIGSIGSLIKRKANDHLLRAVARLRPKTSVAFHVVLVGEGPECEHLEALARELHLEDCVHFVGFQANALAWVASMDIVVLASRKEGLPRVLLEAMLLSKPVVASKVVGSAELVLHEESGFLYPYGDEDALADAVQRLLEDAALRQTMGARGRELVLAHYSIERYVSRVDAALTEALS